MIKIVERDKTHWFCLITPRMYNILEYFKKNSFGLHKRNEVIKGIEKILTADNVNAVDVQATINSLSNTNGFPRLARTLKEIGFLKKEGRGTATFWSVKDVSFLENFFKLHDQMKQVQRKNDFAEGFKKTEKSYEVDK